MYPELLPNLRCLSCQSDLRMQVAVRDDTTEIIVGQLACRTCAASYPVRDGIADFLGAVRPSAAAQLINDWRLTAWGYERLWRPFALTLLSQRPFPYRHELPLIAALIEPQRGGLYLDIACSNGLYARALTRAMRGATGHAVGVDHALPMLVEARRVARTAGLRISYIRAEAQRLPIASGAARGVTIGGSLNEIGDLDGCLSEVRRTLAADGRYVAMTLTQATTGRGRAVQNLAASGGIRFWTPDELVACFRQHGLRSVGRWRYGIVLFTQCLPVV
jgi:SAM-dependent methyltransferase